MTIGEMIRTKREAQGMTQQTLAEKLYVSRQTVSRWESGSRCPDVMMAKRIAVILDVSLDDLVPGEEVADYAPSREMVSGMKKMLRGIFLLILSVWCMVFGAKGSVVLVCLSFILLAFAIVSFFMGYYNEEYTIDNN